MQMESFNMARHCTTWRINGTSTLEMLSSIPWGPQYFWPPPVPCPLRDHRPDDAGPGLPEPHPQVEQNAATPRPSGLERMHISALIEDPRSDQSMAGAHSLGSEPRIGYRAARRYGVCAGTWDMRAQQRWESP